ncbi:MULTISPECIES: FkbM family methyltransferase [Rhodobacterales]|uniref:FkbM family methyltransferase n=1 Tax=Rhodobacterales TaxID=204455 RepID=UPI0015F04A31|nr:MULTISPECIES: FkbM family methyltransferase [Rhodobacterales]MDO6589602.1 FkbM family methyltransferase [Yoonia sp. 1_MG-2023]
MVSTVQSRPAFLVEQLQPAQKLRVVDVGANPLSPPPYQKLLEDGLCHVWGFEPQQDAYEQLLKECGPNESYFPNAVGDGRGHTLYVSPHSGFTSIFPFHIKGFTTFGFWRPRVRRFTEHAIDTVRLDDLEALPQIDCLKIDVQGAEKMIIDNGAQKLSDAVVVIPEVRFNQLYEGEPMFAGLDITLRDQGFMLHKFQSLSTARIGSSVKQQIRQNTRRSHLIDGDAVYIRDMRDDDSISSEQLKKLAIFADAVFDSPDLTCHCLDRLVQRNKIDASIVRAYADMVAS